MTNEKKYIKLFYYCATIENPKLLRNLQQESEQLIHSCTLRWPGDALEYEGDGYVPTGERKQGAFGIGFRIKKGFILVCDLRLFWCELPKIGGHLVLILSNLSEKLSFSAENWQNFDIFTIKNLF